MEQIRKAILEKCGLDEDAAILDMHFTPARNAVLEKFDSVEQFDKAVADCIMQAEELTLEQLLSSS